MDRIRLHIGSVVSGGIGTNDNRRDVEFVGEELARRTEYDIKDDGSVSDSRGTTETLYRTADGRYVVHVKDWSYWQGETTTYRLVEVDAKDLDVGGRFEELGREAGIARPLTLDEALTE